MRKETLKNGRRYAIVNRKSEKIRNIIATAPAVKGNEDQTIDLLPDHAAVELPSSVTSNPTGRSVRDFDALGTAYDKAVEGLPEVGSEQVKMTAARPAIAAKTSTRSPADVDSPPKDEASTAEKSDEDKSK